ncbi:MAG TPA: acyl carrier protein [Bacteroidia bacterium]|nr:acyl carrier protein [Bacteroidia bacterium]
MTAEEIKDEIRNYVTTTIIQNKGLTITDSTALITEGIMDSISTLKLVDFLENRFAVSFEPHDVDRENLDSIDLIAAFVAAKM